MPAGIVGLVCAVAVRFSGPGPVIFRQQRIGRDGQPFVALKFRSMLDGPNPVFPDDSRFTPVGRFLRRLSLDELPQLVNVLRGEMSVVGPRPALPYQVERYDALQQGRLAVRPGITGLAQVQGRNALTWAQRIEWDLDYVERQSLWLDLRIIARTIAVTARGSGLGHSGMVDPISEIHADDPGG